MEQPGITHKREKEKASRQPEAAPPSNLMLIPGAEERKEIFSRSLSLAHTQRGFKPNSETQFETASVGGARVPLPTTTQKSDFARPAHCCSLSQQLKTNLESRRRRLLAAAAQGQWVNPLLTRAR